jgi:predicted aconitase with swiveling domain
MNFRKLAVAILLLWAFPVWAAPTFNAQSSNSADSTTVSVSHTASGTDRCVVIGVYQGTDHTITAISYGAQTPTLIGTQNRLSLYGLVNPNTGAQTVGVTSNQTGGIFIGVVSYTGCAQTSTYGTPVTATTSETTSISAVDVTSATGALVVDVAVMINTEQAADGTQTERISQDDSGVGFWSFGMSEKAGAATVTMTWTSPSTAGDNEIVAVSIAAAGGGGGSSVPVKFRHYRQMKAR